jgi:two-component system CheB/CheR fusion protein
MPYRTLDNFISGAVLTFTLITHYKQLEYKLNAVSDYSVNIIHMMGEAAVQLDRELRICNVNPAFLNILDVNEKQIIGTFFTELMQKYAKTEVSVKLLKQYLCSPSATYKSHKIEGKNGKTLELTINHFMDTGINIPLFVMVLLKQL